MLKKTLVSTLVVACATGVTQAKDLDLQGIGGFKEQIIGGIEATPNEYPFMVSLKYEGTHQCGASILDANHVLTAAHCTENKSPSIMTVRFGMHKQNDLTGVQTIQVSEKKEHPDYNPRTYVNDVAILKLAEPIKAELMKPVTLATDPLMASAGQPGQYATVAGWGNTNAANPNYPNELRKVEVPVISNEQCRSAGGGYNNIIDSNICAGFPQGEKDSCAGDSGGPLFVSYSGDIHQIGIVSWGEGCAVAGKAGVYARVTSFLNWIKDNSQYAAGGDNGSGGGSGNVDNSGSKTISANRDDWARTEITVPANASQLVVNISGGSGDADLYLSQGEEPTLDFYQCAPFLTGSNETCTIDNPDSGTWYIGVNAYEAFNNVKLNWQVK